MVVDIRRHITGKQSELNHINSYITCALDTCFSLARCINLFTSVQVSCLLTFAVIGFDYILFHSKLPYLCWDCGRFCLLFIGLLSFYWTGPLQVYIRTCILMLGLYIYDIRILLIYVFSLFNNKMSGGNCLERLLLQTLYFVCKNNCIININICL